VGEILILYVAFGDQAVNVALVQEEGREQRPIFLFCMCSEMLKRDTHH
jgi:hypothetical protein